MKLSVSSGGGSWPRAPSSALETQDVDDSDLNGDPKKVEGRAGHPRKRTDRQIDWAGNILQIGSLSGFNDDQQDREGKFFLRPGSRPCVCTHGC